MYADPDAVTLSAWNAEPWPSELFLFVVCKTPGYPNAGQQLPCMVQDLWAGEFRLKKPQICAHCLEKLPSGTIAIRALYLDQGAKYIHRRLAECKTLQEATDG